jgi:hypothetical protein
MHNDHVTHSPLRVAAIHNLLPSPVVPPCTVHGCRCHPIHGPLSASKPLLSLSSFSHFLLTPPPDSSPSSHLPSSSRSPTDDGELEEARPRAGRSGPRGRRRGEERPTAGGARWRRDAGRRAKASAATRAKPRPVPLYIAPFFSLFSHWV